MTANSTRKDLEISPAAWVELKHALRGASLAARIVQTETGEVLVMDGIGLQRRTKAATPATADTSAAAVSVAAALPGDPEGTCIRVYREWDTNASSFVLGDCPYRGSPCFDEKNVRQKQPVLDKCSHTAAGCRVRYGIVRTIPILVDAPPS